jgi:hypothetical protein
MAVFENQMLRRIFRRKGQKVIEGSGKLHVRIIMMSILVFI